MLHGPLHDHITTTYGLPRNSILNTSKFFHIVNGLAPDKMHDVLEGSLQYEVKELLKHFIYVERYFTLGILTDGINDFPYVLSDKATRPAMIVPSVLASNDHSIKQKGLHILKLTYLYINISK